jgi:large subunit ribosomal protein L13
MKTFTPNATDVTRKWWVVDAEGKVLGRLASEVAQVLRGKHKAMYATHVDTGDFVIVINADKIRLTGNKADKKEYFRHTGYMGGEKFIPFKVMLAEHPERVITLAVKGMLPKNNLGRLMLRKLKVYAGPNHPHEAQQPETLEIA